MVFASMLGSLQGSGKASMDESMYWLLAALAAGVLASEWVRRRAVANRAAEAARQLARDAATAERTAAERAEVERERQAQAEAERVAAADARRAAAAQADAEHRAVARAEQAAAAERELAAQAEARRLATAQAERMAAAEAEAERTAAAERERAASARAEADRVAAAQAEAARLAAAQGQARRNAEALAQRERAAALALAAEQAARAEAERQAAAAAATRLTPRASKSADQTLVLVADDSKVVRIKTGRLLAQHQYQVAYAIDGLDAVQQMQSGRPDLVITDVEMPGMDGFELTRHIRSNAQTAQLPVIMITAADDRHREQADQAGVSVLLGKPYAEDALIAHIRLAMGQGQAPAQAAGNTCHDAANALA